MSNRNRNRNKRRPTERERRELERLSAILDRGQLAQAHRVAIGRGR